MDKDRGVRRLLRSVLEPQGYRVFEAEDGATGLSQAVERKPDVIILEPALPDREGLAVLQDLREWSNTPVLVLSEQGASEAKVAALDAGASDYMSKPFDSAELLARLRVLQRPLLNQPDGPLLIEGDLVANLTTHEITLGGAPSCLPQRKKLFFTFWPGMPARSSPGPIFCVPCGVLMEKIESTIYRCWCRSFARSSSHLRRNSCFRPKAIWATACALPGSPHPCSCLPVWVRKRALRPPAFMRF